MDEKKVKIMRVSNGYIVEFDPGGGPYKCCEEVHEKWKDVPPAIAKFFGEEEKKDNGSK